MTSKRFFLSFANIVENEVKEALNLLKNEVENCEVKRLNDIVSHIMTFPGKKLRASIVILLCKMLEHKVDKNDIKIAAAIEVIHNATLLHDDVIDNSEYRRGLVTANKVWSNKSSILTGDFLLSLSFKWIVETENLEILSLISNASCKIVEGEFMQMIDSKDIDMTVDQYIKIITNKTAILFSSACKCAGILSKQDAEVSENLWNFGIYLGISFQIMDDILDYFSSKEDMGKKTGEDFAERKNTLPLILAMQELDIKKQEKIRKFFAKEIELEFVEVKNWIEETNTLEKTLKILDSNLEKSKNYKNKIYFTKHEQKLNELISFFRNRNF